MVVNPGVSVRPLPAPPNPSTPPPLTTQSAQPPSPSLHHSLAFAAREGSMERDRGVSGTAGERRDRGGRAAGEEEEPERSKKPTSFYFLPAGGRRLYVIAIGQPLKSLRWGAERRVEREWGAEVFFRLQPPPSFTRPLCPFPLGGKRPGRRVLPGCRGRCGSSSSWRGRGGQPPS